MDLTEHITAEIKTKGAQEAGAEIAAYDKQLDSLDKDREVNIKTDKAEAGVKKVSSASTQARDELGRFMKSSSDAGDKMDLLGKKTGKDGGLGKVLNDLGDTIGKGLNSALDGLKNGLSTLGGLASTGLSAAGSAAMYGMLAAAAGALVAALAPLAAALLSLASIFGGVMIAGGLLMMVLKPIIEAVSAYTAAQDANNVTGATALQQARARQQAEHGLEMAVRGLADAEAALAKARKPATALDMTSAQLGLRAANLAAADAVAALAKQEQAAAYAQQQHAQTIRAIAKETDDFTGKTVELVSVQRGTDVQSQSPADLEREHQRALLAVEQAQLAVAEQQKRINDLIMQGTENDPNVIAAKRGVQDATYGVQQAELSLHDALNANAAAFDDYNKQMSKLSPAGQEFVRFITGELLPKFLDLGKKLQEAMLPGLEAGIKAAEPLLAALTPIFVQMSGVVGDLAKQFGEWLGKPETVKLISTILTDMSNNLGKMLDVALPFIEGFLNLMVEAQPVTQALMDMFKKFGDMFLEWSKSDDAKKFMTAATETIGVLGDILPDVASAFADLLKDMQPEGLELFKELMKGITEIIKDPDFHKMMKDITNWLIDAIPHVVDFIEAIISHWDDFKHGIDVLEEWFGWFQTGAGIVKDFVDGAWANFQTGLDQIRPILNAVGDVFHGLWDTIKGVGEVVVGWWDIISGIFSGDWGKVWDGVKEVFFGTWDTIKGIFETVWGAIKFFWEATIYPNVVQPMVDKFNWLKDTLVDGFNKVKDTFSSVWNWISDNVITPFKSGLGTLGEAFGAVGGVIHDAIKGIVSAWNQLDFGIHISVPDWVPLVGGKSFDIDDIFPDVNFMAQGGMGTVDKPTLFVAGEAGKEDFQFIPHSKGGIQPQTDTNGGGGLSKQDIRDLIKAIEKARPISVTTVDGQDPMHFAAELARRL